MLKSKFFKVIIAMMCIVNIILPHTSIVLAAALTNENPNEVNTVKLISSEYREGGAESSESLSDDGTDEYDRNAYHYTFGGHTSVLKVLREDDKDETTESYLFSDAFYCLDGNNSFPSINGAIEYNRTITNFFEENPATLGLSDANYNSLCWLLDNIYLRKQMTASQRAAQKDALIIAAFAEELNSGYENAATVDDIKAVITDDDIDVIQQWAIWYFTNYGEATIQDVPFTNDEKTLPTVELTDIFMNEDSMESTRYSWLTMLYQYFVNTALEHKNVEFVASRMVYPTIANKNVTCEIDGTNYKVGPFKVTAPSTELTSGEYTIKLTDGNNELARESYVLKDVNGNVIDKNVNEIFDTEYFVYLPISGNTVTNAKLELVYTKSGTKASVWQAEDATYQPLVLVTKEAETVNDNVLVPLQKVNYDLALRKYVVAVNDKEVKGREPNVDVSGLQNGTSNTAEYKHKKEPVEVENGDTVTFRIAVYNEGDVEAKATEVVDYLPEGLEFVADNQTNKDFGWVENNGVVTTNIMQNTSIPAFDKVNGNLQGTYVDIVCKIVDSAKSGAILTNIAEIKGDNIEDRDSTSDSLSSSIDSIDKGSYIGKDNKTDLSDSNNYYKGFEDDDDFEKVVVKGKAFDLSLQKFITKVNGKNVEPSREPVVDTSVLKNGSTNAKYTTVKTPVLVQKGDIVTYKIRVYNEGEMDGYAESVADYLPEGLGYLVNHNTNIDNYWALPTGTGVKTVKLSEITNGTKNLKKDDFTGVTDLANVDVVAGKVKLESTALSSKNSDNLLKAFDGSDKLAYKDIEVVCIVLADTNLTNVAEVIKNVDKNKEEVVDRDSAPNTVDPDNYPGNDENQDDNDYENLTVKNFDLALQKFISGLNKEEVKGREPKISLDENKKIKYEHPDTALEVNNGDVITYTIRVYNEGETDGYAAEIADNIPSGLVFDKDNETNKKYGWVMLDSNGNVTTDASKAVEIRTDYLSKEKSEARGENALLKAFDLETGNLFYLDVKVAFKVDSKSTNDTIINVAEITKDTDSDGNEIEDVDSTPNNKKDEEDDLDKEKIHVGYFDLALQKDLVKAIVTEGDKTKEIPSNNGEMIKVEVHRKKINSTIVKFVYNITVKNEGTIPGYAKEITDYVPEGLKFVQEDNKNWKASSDAVITTAALEDTLIMPGETVTVEVVLRWVNGENNMGLKTNIAEISKDYNDANDSDDIDSTPGNKIEKEDDIDDAQVLLSISTGSAPVYVILTTTVLLIISTGVILIKKYVL